ncbi:cbb3-type cytochrome oxidase assembly protein CcoS [Ghiorsea bivora]|uniref:cbb3-type cytochrome oxidase assembly protein CcoS n=1 Tax=Ghiorsea bivora TaxID=1485545 RepID=UPI00056DC204|nr:cbb3-type cytochrome oxidase assembly protein CcoS [Ghiorsea bivora]
MDIILMLIPAALLFSIIALLVFRWSVKSDQYDDMAGEAFRILMDDEDMIPESAKKVPHADLKKKELENKSDGGAN